MVTGYKSGGQLPPLPHPPNPPLYILIIDTRMENIWFFLFIHNYACYNNYITITIMLKIARSSVNTKYYTYKDMDSTNLGQELPPLH